MLQRGTAAERARAVFLLGRIKQIRTCPLWAAEWVTLLPEVQ
jgi:hypothetical protein